MANPTYVTVTSSGSSPWISVDWLANPVNIGIAVRTSSLSSNWQVDVTMDDPFGTFPSSAGPTTFLSSQVGTLTGGSTNAVGSILIPIAALRLTVPSTGGSATMTVLQAGV